MAFHTTRLPSSGILPSSTGSPGSGKERCEVRRIGNFNFLFSENGKSITMASFVNICANQWLHSTILSRFNCLPFAIRSLVCRSQGKDKGKAKKLGRKPFTPFN